VESWPSSFSLSFEGWVTAWLRARAKGPPGQGPSASYCPVTAGSGRLGRRVGTNGLRYRDLDELSARVACWLLGRGITAGDRVGLMTPNTPEFAELYYGILRAGAVVVPMNPLFKAR
jgi:acyl-CoA synthetase (AMP-forming)/AMP-acid ligase II